MSELNQTPTPDELEEALLRLAQRSYIELMKMDMNKASEWYDLVKDSLIVLGPDRAEREVKSIMSEYLNRTQQFSGDFSEKLKEFKDILK